MENIKTKLIIDSLLSLKYKERINWSAISEKKFEIQFEHEDALISFDDLVKSMENKGIFNCSNFMQADYSELIEGYEKGNKFVVFLELFNINWRLIIKLANVIYKRQYLIKEETFGDLKQARIIAEAINKKVSRLENNNIVLTNHDISEYKNNIDILNTLIYLEKEKFIKITDIDVNLESYGFGTREKPKNFLIELKKLPDSNFEKKLVQEIFRKTPVAIIDTSLQQKSPTTTMKETDSIMYEITYTEKERTILLNNIKLKKPDFDSENERFFSYVYANQNRKITIKELEKNCLGDKETFKKEAKQIIQNLGFEGDIKNLFFPNISKTAVIFRNPIYKKDLSDMGIKYLKFCVK